MASRAEPDDHALGLSRGGLSTKVHLASDSRARPLSLHITAGQAGDAPAFAVEAYKQRNAVERCINRLKQWRGLAMRTEKLVIAYQAALDLAAVLIWTAA